jgi:ATP-binding cassette, subfamily B, bacterial
MKLIKSYNFPTIIQAINRMARRKWLFLGCIFVFCAVEIAGSVLSAIGMRGTIDALTGTASSALLHSVFLILLGYAIWWVYTPISSYCCAWASKGTVQRLKTDLVDHIIRMPMRALDQQPKGELLSSLTNDIDCLQQIYDWYFSQICHAFFGGIAGVILMAVIDWRFAIVVFTLGSVSVLVTAKFNRMLERSGEALQQALAQTSADAYELIKGAKTLRLLKLQAHFINRIQTSSQSEADRKLDAGKISARLKAIIAAITALTYAVILVAGALFVRFGLTGWGTVVALMGLKTATDMLFVEFGDFMAGMQSCVAGVKRLNTLLAQPAEPDEIPSVSITPSAQLLSVGGVSFAYTAVPVLNNFNLCLPRHGLTILSGESGMGKSTVMKLLLGLYPPESGTITFDGDAPSTLDNIRAKTAYVPQEPLLFRGSVLENILFGNPAAALEDAEYAARLAGADIFISALEQGYDTILADDGKSLSGGQKQRLSIARALVKNAPILLLDEITSALDAEAAERILETVLHIAQTHSVLLITHNGAFDQLTDQKAAHVEL